MRHFLILGRQPLLSLAEARAVFGGPAPELAGDMAIFDLPHWDDLVLQERLAGTVKLGEIIAEVSIKELTAERIADELDARPRGKRINFGLTVFGGSEGAQSKTRNLPLQVKRLLQERGRSVRWVNGDKTGISPAAVAKMKLTTEGYDLAIGLLGDRAVIGLTTAVQNADAWSERDYGRPFRDTETGMLPPKLARLMVNLALHPATRLLDYSTTRLLDPFCGGGTVLMEAALLGVRMIVGSDIETKQIGGSQENLDWLVERSLLTASDRANIQLLTQPAQTLDRHLKPNSIDAIVTEGFLGKPLNGHETREFLQRQKEEIETLWFASLKALAPLLKKDGRIVCIWPVFKTIHETVAVDLKADLPALGYRLIDPLAGWKDKPVTLTYAREEQHVKRNIIVLEKI